MIRKGRKQRQRLSDMDSMSSINSRLSNDGPCNNGGSLGSGLAPSPIYPPSMNVPKSRHSIDLGNSSPQHVVKQQQHIITPRYEISEEKSIHQIFMLNSSLNVIIQPTLHNLIFIFSVTHHHHFVLNISFLDHVCHLI